MNYRSHDLYLVLKIRQTPNPRDEQLRDVSLAARDLSNHSKKVRHLFQHSDHRVLQFSGFTCSIFLFKQGWSRQSYQLALQKIYHGNLNDIYFQNVCTNILAYTVLYQNFYFYTSCFTSFTLVVLLIGYNLACT